MIKPNGLVWKTLRCYRWWIDNWNQNINIRRRGKRACACALRCIAYTIQSESECQMWLHRVAKFSYWELHWQVNCGLVRIEPTNHASHNCLQLTTLIIYLQNNFISHSNFLSKNKHPILCKIVFLCLITSISSIVDMFAMFTSLANLTFRII